MIADELFSHGNGMVDDSNLIGIERWFYWLFTHDAAIPHKTNDINRMYFASAIPTELPNSARRLC
jgi:hypothetical protein